MHDQNWWNLSPGRQLSNPCQVFEDPSSPYQVLELDRFKQGGGFGQSSSHHYIHTDIQYIQADSGCMDRQHLSLSCGSDGQALQTVNITVNTPHKSGTILQLYRCGTIQQYMGQGSWLGGWPFTLLHQHISSTGLPPRNTCHKRVEETWHNIWAATCRL